MVSKVYIVQCPDYDGIEEKLASLINLMGGMGNFAQTGEKIILKPNLLRAARPEQAVCTHPSVLAAMGRLARKEGAHPVMADSPGGGYRYTAKVLKDIYRTSGMLDAAQQAGVEVNWDTTSRPVSFAEGMLTKHFDIITPVVEADGVINLCKNENPSVHGDDRGGEKPIWRDSGINQNRIPCQTS